MAVSPKESVAETGDWLFFRIENEREAGEGRSDRVSVYWAIPFSTDRASYIGHEGTMRVSEVRVTDKTMQHMVWVRRLGENILLQNE